jgi:CheY-like chemotaxis protein
VPKYDVWVHGNAGRIHQALINLCVNAQHAMPDGGTLRVELGTVRSGVQTPSRPADLRQGDFARIRVVDDGCVIAPDDLRRIFDPFYSTKSPDQGSGLGLFVVHGVAAEHGGGVGVESTPGVSTTFDFWLPVQPRASTADAPGDELGRPSRPLSLLLADDEPRILQAAGECLRDEGHRVLAFTDAVGLEETFMRDPAGFDAVIVDYRLADDTGLDVARRLRDRRPDLPILLCSGFITTDVERACRSAGIALLQKPYRFEELLSSVAGVLGRDPAPAPGPRG